MLTRLLKNLLANHSQSHKVSANDTSGGETVPMFIWRNLGVEPLVQLMSRHCDHDRRPESGTELHQSERPRGEEKPVPAEPR